MEALKDIWASVAAGVKDRTTNPLTFAFLLSWGTWNYKFFVVVFGDGKTGEKLAVIDSMYPKAASTFAGGALLFPVVTALLYVFAYPFVTEKVIPFYRSRLVRIANGIKVAEAARLITPQEAAALTRRHEADRKKWENTESQLEAQVDELRNALAAAEQQIEKQRTNQSEVAPKLMASTNMDEAGAAPSIEEKKEVEVRHGATVDKSISNESLAVTNEVLSHLTDRRMSLLVKLSESPYPMEAKDIAVEAGLNYSVALLELEEMLKLSLIEVIRTSRGSTQLRWTLTPLGRTIAVTALSSSRK